MPDEEEGMAEGIGRPGAQLVIISGPSGVGKDAIIDVMRRRTPRQDRHYVVTCTTRERRDGEVDGVHYHFLPLDEFHRLRRSGQLLEAAEVYGRWYGTPRRPVAEALEAGQDAILKIDVQGARAVQERVPEALLIFVVPPSLEELEARLTARRSETPEQLERRRADARTELARAPEYDHVVVNETGQLERTAAEIDAIIAAEHASHPDRRIRL